MQHELHPHYSERLATISEEMEASDLLTQYSDTEEEDDFKLLCDYFEPQIALIYQEVAAYFPLQLIALEKQLLNPSFEGLYLPRLLGYSVLRGEVDKFYKYVRPQDHFRDILTAICQSSNFEFLRRRIGQTLQMGFALSSDIWITNLIEQVSNKKIRYFLQGQKNEKFRDEADRATAYKRYMKQFVHENYFTADFPTNFSELKVQFSTLKHFIEQRIKLQADNSSLSEILTDFFEREEFKKEVEYAELLALYVNFFTLEEAQKTAAARFLNEARQSPPFAARYFTTWEEVLKGDLPWQASCDRQVDALLDKTTKDDLSEYYDLMEMIHSKGYVQPEVMEAVRVYYNRHEGLSTVNVCVRYTVLRYIVSFLENIEERGYHDYFELSKTFNAYMTIFANQQFNQHIEDASMKYVDKLMKKYVDKRGRDYQDIKKFVANTFTEVGFLKEKEIVEMFKTRRKRKADAK